MTPMQAIRAKCLDCCCGQKHEVKLCTVITCPLHSLRLGKSSNRKPMSEEQRAAAIERLAKARLARGKKQPLT